MSEYERKEIIEALACVDEVIISEHQKGTKDKSVCREIAKIKPYVFANGGDRFADDIPEFELCKKLGIEMIFNVGKGGKIRSSSDLLRNYQKHISKKTEKLSERYQLDFSDSFVMSQEPELSDGSGTPLRVEQSFINNQADATLGTSLTDRLQLQLTQGYAFNNYLGESNSNPVTSLIDSTTLSSSIIGTYELTPRSNLNIRYDYEQMNLDDSKQIGPNISADVRDSQTQRLTLGAEHSITPQLSVGLRGGIELVEFSNAPHELDPTLVSPYAQANLAWRYLPNSIFSGSVTYQQRPTDIPISLSETPLLSQQSLAVSGQISHQLTSFLNASIIAKYQNSDYGFATENFSQTGIDLTYRINDTLSANAGYNFDILDSEFLRREYNRNRFYFGFQWKLNP